MGIISFFKNLKAGGQAIKGEPALDRVYSSENEFPDKKTAFEKFKQSKTKLLNVDNWSNISGITSTFELFDEHGQRFAGAKVRENFFIKIVLPAPSPENWVKVTKIRNHKDLAYIVVSPSTDPTDRRDETIEHFFVKEATSTFKVELKDKTIRAFEIGQNEGVNLGEDAGNRDAVNILISSGGWAGLQRIQWKNLTDYFVHIDE